MHLRLEVATTKTIDFAPLCAGYLPLQGHHRHLLADDVRTNAFLSALEHVVKPGDVVVDLGTGTGVLAAKASRLGARKVYAIEATSMIDVAHAMFVENNIKNVEIVRGRSTEIDLPEKANVIVSECFGPLAVGGTMIEAVADARDRFLERDDGSGTILPASVDLFLTPIESEACWSFVNAFSAERRYGLTMASLDRLARNNAYRASLEPNELLAPALQVHAVDLQTFSPPDVRSATAFTSSVTFRASRSGNLHGYAGWFVAKLASSVTLDTGPGQPQTVWNQVFFPLEEATPIVAGAEIALTFGVTPSKVAAHTLYWSWRTMIAGKTFDQSTQRSFPAPQNVPPTPTRP